MLQAMSSRYKIIGVILVLTLLPTGCLVGPKYEKPEQQKVENFKHAPVNADTIATVTNVKWFDLFNDHVLKNIINKGLENNYDLKIALTRIERSRAKLEYSKSNLYHSFQYGSTLNSNQKVIIPSR